MTVPQGIGPLKQALVRALRDITALKAAVGSDGIHEGVVLPDTDYPFVVYDIPVESYEYDFDGGVAKAIAQVMVVSNDTVQAGNLDQLVANGLQDKVLDFDGTTLEPTAEPSTLHCRRLLSLSGADFDGEGNRVYQVGARYLIWTQF